MKLTELNDFERAKKNELDLNYLCKIGKVSPIDLVRVALLKGLEKNNAATVVDLQRLDRLVTEVAREFDFLLN